MRTFYVSHADVTELSQLLTGIRVPASRFSRRSSPTRRATPSPSRHRVGRAGRRADDHVERQAARRSHRRRADPRGEPRAGQAVPGSTSPTTAIGGVFSPEVAPGTGGAANAASGLGTPFNLNTISQGISTRPTLPVGAGGGHALPRERLDTKTLGQAPAARRRRPEADAEPGRRRAVPSTTFTPRWRGGARASFAYRTVGIMVEMTQRVTYEGEIILELCVESGAQGRGSVIAGQSLPSVSCPARW